MHSVEQESTNSPEIMPTAISQIPSSQNLQTALIGSDGGASGGRTTETKARSEASGEARARAKEIPQSDRITLSIKKASATEAYVAAAPYAEIWKNGRKVAEIDSRGEVSMLDGGVTAPPAGGTGLALAAQRAAVIAHSIGGEIRVAGMLTDVSTLAMKARLSETYR